ncbi:MAG: hypothetical protein KDA68_21490 [Planctomycetaceae bacterium]|nr:hypothetical protein [Planctomycetaceae bacterium]
MTRMMHVWVVLLFVGVFGGWLSAEDGVGEVLLVDGFEKGVAAPEGWKQGGAVPGVKYVYEKSRGGEGKRSLSLQKSARTYFPIAAWTGGVTCDAAKEYLRLSVLVKAEKSSKSIVEVQFLGEGEKFLGKEWVAYIGAKEVGDSPVTHDWKRYEGSVKIPEQTREVVVSLQIYGPGKVWFDDLEVKYAGEGDEAGGSDRKKLNVGNDRPEMSVADLKKEVREIRTEAGGVVRYLRSPAAEEKTSVPRRARPLLIVLPGGNGSEEFFPFVKNIQEFALEDDFEVVQLIAPPQIVWPTKRSLASVVPTEESIELVIENMGHTTMIDRKRVYALAWSSSGPAVYAAVLDAKSSLAGAMIAMSVFREDDYESLAGVKGKRIYLYHSPEDEVCPYRMSQEAVRVLNAAGGKVKLVEYQGGHGWHGAVHESIRAGIGWLQGVGD